MKYHANVLTILAFTGLVACSAGEDSDDGSGLEIGDPTGVTTVIEFSTGEVYEGSWTAEYILREDFPEERPNSLRIAAEGEVEDHSAGIDVNPTRDWPLTSEYSLDVGLERPLKDQLSWESRNGDYVSVDGTITITSVDEDAIEGTFEALAVEVNTGDQVNVDGRFWTEWQVSCFVEWQSGHEDVENDHGTLVADEDFETEYCSQRTKEALLGQ